MGKGLRRNPLVTVALAAALADGDDIDIGIVVANRAEDICIIPSGKPPVAGNDDETHLAAVFTFLHIGA